MKKLKVLVATKETQGRRKDDFCFVPSGEFVKLGLGCDRSLIGFSCNAHTTTIRVVSVELTREQYIHAYIESNKAAGWSVDNVAAHRADAISLLKIAAAFRTGSVLEYRNGVFITRKPNGR